MSSPKPIPKDVYRAASAWLVQRAESAWPTAREDEFSDWLRADPSHAAAYAKLERVWGDVSELSSLAELAPLSNDGATLVAAGGAPHDVGRAFDSEGPRLAVPTFDARLPVVSSQRAAPAVAWLPVRPRTWGRALAAGLVMAVAVTGTLMHLRSPEVMQTQLAEVREFKLPDGSTVTLGAKSTLDLEFSKAERRVVLHDGEAFFQVAKDAARPFIVEAGATQARAVGTQFDVRRGAKGVTVAVVEGVVEVSETASATRTVNAHEPQQHLLTAGQRTEIRQAATSVATSAALPRDLVKITPIPIDVASAWRYGRLVYEDRPLEELVADVNRYYTPGVELATPGMGALPVTAAFRVDEIPQTFAALARALPVTAMLGSDGRIVLHATPR